MKRMKLKSLIVAFIRVRTGCQWIREHRLKGPIILVYHGIVDKITDPILEQYCIDVKAFSKHIAFLKSRYIPVPLFEMINELKTVKKTPHDWISITLDDALQNQVTLGASVSSKKIFHGVYQFLPVWSAVDVQFGHMNWFS